VVKFSGQWNPMGAGGEERSDELGGLAYCTEGHQAGSSLRSLPHQFCRSR